jgi:membrane protease YdiL (CAAX protease family)
MWSVEHPQETAPSQREDTSVPDEQAITGIPQRPVYSPYPRRKRKATTAQGIVAYVAITFGLAWALWIPVWLLRVPAESGFFQFVFLAGAFAPAVAAIIVRARVTREGFADAGLRPHLWRAWPYYLFAWLWPLLILGTAVALATILGLFTPRDVSASVTSSLMVTLISIPLFWGEEFGWRSYLQIRLFSSRPLLAAVATGLIWGVWHYPAVLAGYLPNEHGLIGVLIYPWYMIPSSIILGWLRLRSDSVWAPTLAHAANNITGPLVGTALIVSGGHGDLLFSPRGILVLIPLSILCAWIIFSGQLKPRPRAPASPRPIGKIVES